jgi:hypothetical protein
MCPDVEGLVTNYSTIKPRKIAGLTDINSIIKVYILSMKPINTLCCRVRFHTWPGTYGFLTCVVPVSQGTECSPSLL